LLHFLLTGFPQVINTPPPDPPSPIASPPFPPKGGNHKVLRIL
jgi:hypothetical protein